MYCVVEEAGRAAVREVGSEAVRGGRVTDLVISAVQDQQGLPDLLWSRGVKSYGSAATNQHKMNKVL